MVRPEEIGWGLQRSSDTEDLQNLHRSQGAEWYGQQKTALKEFACSYFNTVEGCNSPLNKSISPMGATAGGGKILKVRWALPGGGKRSGLRLILVAFCAERRVVVAGAWARNEDPEQADVDRATSRVR